jgi:hypothetical protein
MSLKFWSTPESIASETPSIMAIAETITAVGLYWYCAIHFDNYLPLMIPVAFALLVLLRSDESVALGVEWFLRYEFRRERYTSFLEERFSYLEEPSAGSKSSKPTVIGSVWARIRAFVWIGRDFALGQPILPDILLAALSIRITATARHVCHGIRCLPANFRRLTLCTSPSELPELVPDLSKTVSRLTLRGEFGRFKNLTKHGAIEQRTLGVVYALMDALIVFLPVWLFRFTIKSTVWFWWPIAYLGADRNKWRDPELLHWRNRHGLRALATYIAAAFTILSFIITNILLTPDFLTGNPLLVVYGFLFQADWHLYPWQVLSLFLAVFSIGVLFWIDDLGAQYRFAKNPSQLKPLRRKFAMFEWVLRVRFLIWLLYMIIVGSQIALYLNSKQCLITPAPKVQQLATEMYGKRTPPLCSQYRL